MELGGDIGQRRGMGRKLGGRLAGGGHRGGRDRGAGAGQAGEKSLDKVRVEAEQSHRRARRPGQDPVRDGQRGLLGGQPGRRAVVPGELLARLVDALDSQPETTARAVPAGAAT